MKKANIMILATGGTIAGEGQSSSKGAYSSGKLHVEKLLSRIPHAKDIANIQAKQIASIGSQELDHKILLLIAQKTNEILKQKDIDGVVIIHGTDTLEESAYFLNLCINTKKPIVFTGSMRPNSSLSSDGDLNIFNAISVAANKKSAKKGVLVVLNDQIHAAREVSKTNTSYVQTFTSPNTGALGCVHYGKVDFYLQSVKKHTYKSEFNIDSLKTLPRVDIIYSHVNDTDIFVNSCLHVNSSGIIHVGLGNGNIYPKTLKALHKAVKKGVVVVRNSRVGSGRISEDGEVDDKEFGFLTSDNLNPQKARILLSLALTKTKNPKKIQKMFLKY